MCLAGGAGAVQVTPTPKALRLSVIIKIVILFQVAAAVCFMLSRRYVDGAVDFAGAFLGMMMFGSSAEEQGFSLQSTLCYLAFAFVFLFWSMTRGVFYFMGKEAPATVLTGWQQYTYQGAVIGDVAIYFALTLLVYLLYSELRRTLDDITNLAQFLRTTDGSAVYSSLPTTEQADAEDVENGTGDQNNRGPGSTDKVYTGNVYKLSK